MATHTTSVVSGVVSGTRVRDLAVPAGPARFLVNAPVGGAAAASSVVVLGHGAGGGPDVLDLAALARVLPAHGSLVLRFEQPWRLAGRGVAPAPTQLDKAWLDAFSWLRHRNAGSLRLRRGVPLVVGGRSAGARVACRTAAELGAVGCVALSFPVHPPGRPERSRIDELAQARVPSLVIAGSRDSFGGPAAIPAGLAHVTVASIPGGDHSFAVPKAIGRSPGQVGDDIAVLVVAWLSAQRVLAR